MPDITMCLDVACSRCATCYRFTARASQYRQAYFVKPPRGDADGDRCPMYWPIRLPVPTTPAPTEGE